MDLCLPGQHCPSFAQYPEWDRKHCRWALIQGHNTRLDHQVKAQTRIPRIKPSFSFLQQICNRPNFSVPQCTEFQAFRCGCTCMFQRYVEVTCVVWVNMSLGKSSVNLNKEWGINLCLCLMSLWSTLQKHDACSWEELPLTEAERNHWIDSWEWVSFDVIEMNWVQRGRWVTSIVNSHNISFRFLRGNRPNILRLGRHKDQPFLRSGFSQKCVVWLWPEKNVWIQTENFSLALGSFAAVDLCHLPNFFSLSPHKARQFLKWLLSFHLSSFWKPLAFHDGLFASPLQRTSTKQPLVVSQSNFSDWKITIPHRLFMPHLRTTVCDAKTEMSMYTLSHGGAAFYQRWIRSVFHEIWDRCEPPTTCGRLNKTWSQNVVPQIDLIRHLRTAPNAW